MSSENRSIKKLWYSHTTEYYTAIKMNEPQLYTATWINNLFEKCFTLKHFVVPEDYINMVPFL